MQEIIPLKKDIVFKTKIQEVTSINLDHDYKIVDDLVEGTLYLSGTYKMTEASVVEEEFLYNIPFSIALSKRVNKSTIKIDIEDFKYETQRDIMSVSIDLEFLCKENEMESETNMEKDSLDNYIDNYFETDTEVKKLDFENKITDNKVIVNEEKKELENDTNVENITSTIINNENKYYTYKVYIVREGDTVESICAKYNLIIDDIKSYNDITNISVGDKIVIPQINNE